MGVGAEDQPFEGIPLPRAVTSFVHKLGVNDNELPDGRKTLNKGQFALSAWDQSILAKGPPQSGPGPGPDVVAPAPAPAPMAASRYAYAPTYAPSPAYAYGQPTFTVGIWHRHVVLSCCPAMYELLSTREAPCRVH